MIQISLKKWSNLSQAERVIAKSLGITPKETKQVKGTTPSPKPKPYLMQAKTHCYLCKSDTEQFFHMILRDDGYTLPYLQSVEVTKDKAQQLEKKIPCKIKDIEASTCQACLEVLMKWSKEDLVKKLIKNYPKARAAILAGGN